MLYKSLRIQLTELCTKKITILTFMILFALVLTNFCLNITQNSHTHYVSQMYDPLYIHTLSAFSFNGKLLLQFYPLLVVMPTAYSYLVDKESMMEQYIKVRSGKFFYWTGKILSIFILTTLLFIIPFIIEMILEVVCFDFSSHGSPTNFSYIDMIEIEKTYFVSNLFGYNKLLYLLFMILLFGMISGIFAVFNYVITVIVSFKYKILTFFPIYMLFYIINSLGAFFDIPYSLNHFQILLMFDETPKNYMVYGFFLLILVIFEILIHFLIIKKDKSL